MASVFAKLVWVLAHPFCKKRNYLAKLLLLALCIPLCDLKMILCPAVGSGPLENTHPHRCCTFFEMTVFAEKPPHPLASSNPLPTDTVNQQLLSWVVDETARKKSARFSIEAILEVC